MATFEEIIPAELRARLQAARSKPRLPRPHWFAEGVRDYHEQAAYVSEVNKTADLAEAAINDEIRAWLHNALVSGQVIATAFPAGAGIGASRVRIEPARWRGLRYDASRNAAIEIATKAIVATGVDFEPAAAAVRKRGRPLVERTENAEAEAQLWAAAAGMTRSEFRQQARRAVPNAKIAEIDARWREAKSGEKCRRRTARNSPDSAVSETR